MAGAQAAAAPAGTHAAVSTASSEVRAALDGACWHKLFHECCPCCRRLTPQITSTQPLSTLWQLTAVSFTDCEYGDAEQLPTAALAALTGLVALDVSDRELLDAAGAQSLKAEAVCWDMIQISHTIQHIHWPLHHSHLSIPSSDAAGMLALC